ncbi:MAG: TetR/AcrR family transcriptional regulator C-terminal domain-containing protein, partial [Pseudonocardia sp.]
DHGAGRLGHVRTGAADPARTLRLLWRGAGAPRRGPRPGRSVDDVVAAAVGLADAAGLDAVTMRGVADRLGVAAMTLYTHVPGKAELLELMLDAVYAATPRTGTAGRPWRERAAAVASANRALYAAHPWAATVATGRPPLGPGLMAKYEHELAAFDGLGLDDVTIDACLTHLLNFVRGVARDVLDARAVRRATAMTDAQWWTANAPLLERVLDPAAYPLAVRVGGAAGAAQGGAYDPERAYDFGLPRVLDGLAALIDR